MATVTKARITASEVMNMDLGDGLFELVRGEIVTLSPPLYWHGFTCGNIYAILNDFGLRTGHGHVATNDSAVLIDDLNVRGADVCYYSEARWPRAQVGQGPPPVPPDLVVEVYSPSNRPGEMLEEVSEYLRAGVPLVWTVHPERRNLAIYPGDDPTPLVLTEPDVVENLPEQPGFQCRVAEFFA